MTQNNIKTLRMLVSKEDCTWEWDDEAYMFAAHVTHNKTGIEAYAEGETEEEVEARCIWKLRQRIARR